MSIASGIRRLYICTPLYPQKPRRLFKEVVQIASNMSGVQVVAALEDRIDEYETSYFYRLPNIIARILGPFL